MNSTRVYNKKIPFIIVLITVVLAFCMLVGSVAAWLIKIYNFNSTDNEIGSVEVELFVNGAKVEGRTENIEGVDRWVCNTPYEIASGSTIRNLNIKMRNNGTIDKYEGDAI